MNAYRLLALTAIVSSLSACNSLMQASLDTLSASLSGPVSLDVTRDQVDTVPYYQIEVTTEYGSAVMALVRVKGDLQYWRASSNQLLLLQDGVVVRTLGFPNDLLGTHLATDSPFRSGLQRIADEQISQRWVDLSPNYQLGIPLDGNLRRTGTETVSILGQEHSLLRIDEQIRAPVAGMSGTNSYWVDPSDGFVMQSRQQVTPSLHVTLTQLRPYKGQP